MKYYLAFLAILLACSLPMNASKTVDGIGASLPPNKQVIKKDTVLLKELDWAGLSRFTATPEESQTLARGLAEQRGWTGYEWDSLVTLIYGESGWRSSAINSSSGACGLFQSLPCDKISNWDDVQTQIEWGLNYIAGSYGSPSSALEAWNNRSPHWY